MARSDGDDHDAELRGLSEDEKIVAEAKDRFKRAYDYESEFRSLYVQDVKFANGDSDNGWQWADKLRNDRQLQDRPALTINKVAQHVALITNDARQNKPSVSVKPVGEQASYEAAQVFEGIIRHIEYISTAQAIYDDASESQVEGGVAYWIIRTKYLDDDTFDQELVMEGVRDQLNVLLDCDITEKDGSDAKWGFVFDEVPRKEFERQYPDAAKRVGSATGTGLGDSDDWVREDNIRVGEYYRIVEKEDELIYMEDEAGVSATFKRSEVPQKYRKQIEQAEKDGLPVKKRKVRTRKLQWFKIAGSEIIDKRDLPGRYIPIVRLIGKERIIEGRLERKGHVRGLKDPQRLYNFNSSAQVEFGALATKSPWTGPLAAIVGNEVQWNNANRSNASYLGYNHLDDEGNPLPKPERPEPPGTSPAFLAGMQIAAKELEMASGQYEAQFGEKSNERSGKAIAERQRQADTITYHFTDNLALAIRYTGKILIDLIPHYYDTERVIQILGKDGTQTKVLVKPDAKVAYEEQKEKDKVRAIFNPAVGKYQVEADVGPAYSTQRQEAWNAFVQITTSSPALIEDVGDLMFQSADFPLADKIAERLKRKARNERPYLFDDEAPTPAMQKLVQELEESKSNVSELLQKLAEMRLKLVGKEQKRDVDAFEAETHRITALSNAQPEVKEMGPDVEAQTKLAMLLALSQMLGVDLSDKIDQHQMGAEESAVNGMAEPGLEPLPGEAPGENVERLPQ